MGLELRELLGIEPKLVARSSIWQEVPLTERGNPREAEDVGVEEREILVLGILNLKCKWEIQQKR